VFRVVLGTGLADPPIGLGRSHRKRTPRTQHPVAGRDPLRSHVWKRDIVHGVEERLVHRVDVDLLRPVGAEPDLLQDDARFGEPAPDVGDEILRNHPSTKYPGSQVLSSGSESTSRWSSVQSRSSSLAISSRSGHGCDMWNSMARGLIRSRSVLVGGMRIVVAPGAWRTVPYG